MATIKPSKRKLTLICYYYLSDPMQILSVIPKKSFTEKASHTELHVTFSCNVSLVSFSLNSSLNFMTIFS